MTGYTLGGGAAWLSRTYGYAADSVVCAEVLLADGRLVQADPDHHPELFWGLRGGGGNFGLVTSLTFRLFPAPSVFSGMSFYPAERAGAILAAYRDWAQDEPEDLNTAVLLMRLPPAPVLPESVRGRQVVALRVFTLIEEQLARGWLERLLRAAGQPLVDGFAVRDFAAASRATNGPDVPPVAHRQLFRSFDRVPDTVLEQLVRDGLTAEAPFAFVELRHWGGAMAERSPDQGPAGHRSTPWSALSVALYPDADHARVDAVLDAFDQRLARCAAPASFLNLLTETDRTATAFTPENHARLRRLKCRYDPDTVFRPSHPIDPS